MLITNISATPYFRLYRNNYPTQSFTDVSGSCGISALSYWCNCAVWGDYDNDGDVDVYFCQGHDSQNQATFGDKLYSNDGDGTFTDVTATAFSSQPNNGAAYSAA